MLHITGHIDTGIIDGICEALSAQGLRQVKQRVMPVVGRFLAGEASDLTPIDKRRSADSDVARYQWHVGTHYSANEGTIELYNTSSHAWFLEFGSGLHEPPWSRDRTSEKMKGKKRRSEASYKTTKGKSSWLSNYAVEARGVGSFTGRNVTRWMSKQAPLGIAGPLMDQMYRRRPVVNMLTADIMQNVAAKASKSSAKKMKNK